MRRMLTLAGREEISRGLAESLEFKDIAVRIGRDASIVSREDARHGGEGQVSSPSRRIGCRVRPGQGDGGRAVFAPVGRGDRVASAGLVTALGYSGVVANNLVRHHPEYLDIDLNWLDYLAPLRVRSMARFCSSAVLYEPTRVRFH
jgi:hypothetical protein